MKSDYHGQRLDVRARRITKLRADGMTVQEICAALHITERQFYFAQSSRRG